LLYAPLASVLPVAIVPPSGPPVIVIDAPFARGPVAPQRTTASTVPTGIVKLTDAVEPPLGSVKVPDAVWPPRVALTSYVVDDPAARVAVATPEALVE
jgi:hypothetical protein